MSSYVNESFQTDISQTAAAIEALLLVMSPSTKGIKEAGELKVIRQQNAKHRLQEYQDLNTEALKREITKNIKTLDKLGKLTKKPTQQDISHYLETLNSIYILLRTLEKKCKKNFNDIAKSDEKLISKSGSNRKRSKVAHKGAAVAMKAHRKAKLRDVMDLEDFDYLSTIMHSLRNNARQYLTKLCRQLEINPGNLTHDTDYDEFKLPKLKSRKPSNLSRRQQQDETQEDIDRIKFLLFCSFYFNAYKKNQFKNPRSQMKQAIINESITNIHQVREYARHNPTKRSAMILEDIENVDISELGESTVSTLEFKLEYFKSYYKKTFTNPFSFMNKALVREETLSHETIVKHAEDNPKSRTASLI